MAKTIRQIMEFASQSTTQAKMEEDDIDISELFDRQFDETENVKDQYENIFNINTTTSKNVAGAFIGESKANWEDAGNGIDMDFLTTNDSMKADNIRAQTDPDTARPTISRETFQSLSKLNVSRPIDLSKAMRLSAQSSLNYRMENVESDGVAAEDGAIAGFLRSGALFGLKTAQTEIKKAKKDVKFNV